MKTTIAFALVAAVGAAIPLARLPKVDTDAVLAHTKVLASDEYEGRAPGTRGEDRTVAYLVDQFKAIGLAPGNTDGTYIQKVPVVGITPDPATVLVLDKGGDKVQLAFKDQVVAWTKHAAETAAIDGSEVVFVGYGVVAPEYGWDDYKGVDVKGKTLLVLVGDPPVPDPADPSQLDPKTFGGRAMTYYGRWTCKYETGARKGAAAVLIVHETGPAGYPFAVVQGKTGEQFDLVTPDRNMGRAAIEGWVPLDQGRRLLAMAGQDFDAVKTQAATRAFRPVPLGVKASMTIHNTLRTIDSRNVVGKWEGSDAHLKDEYVAYTAHWDHFGIGAPIDGDRIYNGAEDNAVGTAGLVEMARAFTKLTPRPKRSILFLAVTGEEQGLIGSQHYAASPIFPLRKTLAAINMDILNVHGRTKDMTLVGLGQSSLDDYAREAAAEQGRVVHGDAEPEKGSYYRSDHFNFARQGVPALDPQAGIDFVGRPPGYGLKVRQEYTERRYHKPSDEVTPDWDMSGAGEDLQVLLAVGYRVAQADRYPEWRPGSEFRARREEMLRR